MCVFRSSRHISVQIVDDSVGKTLASASTYEKDFRDSNASGGNVPPPQLSVKVAERALAAGVTAVAFDRKGYKFHGRVQALAGPLARLVSILAPSRRRVIRLETR